MRWFLVVLSFLSLSFTGCGTLPVAERNNPYQYSAAQDADKTLLFYNNTGGHVRIMTSPGGYYVGRATSGWNCFDLDAVVTTTRGFEFEVTANRGVNTRYNADESVMGQNWKARLGPNPNVWQNDLLRTFVSTRNPCRN